VIIVGAETNRAHKVSNHIFRNKSSFFYVSGSYVLAYFSKLPSSKKKVFTFVKDVWTSFFWNAMASFILFANVYLKGLITSY
jgi:hypothetical protein